jgi:hypothetical protein
MKLDFWKLKFKFVVQHYRDLLKVLMILTRSKEGLTR